MADFMFQNMAYWQLYIELGPYLRNTYQDISNTLIYEHICGDVEQEDNVVLKTNHLL